MKLLRRILVLALFAGLFYGAWEFTHNNESEIVVDLLLQKTPPVPIWAALGVAFVAGVLCTAASLMMQLAQKSLLARRYRKVVTGLESEIHELRNLPLAGAESEGAVVETGAGAVAPDPVVDRSL